MINILKNTDRIGTNNTKEVFGDDILGKNPNFCLLHIRYTLPYSLRVISSLPGRQT